MYNQILLRSKVYFPRENDYVLKRSNTADTKAVIKHLPTIKKQQQSVKLQVLVNITSIVRIYIIKLQNQLCGVKNVRKVRLI